MRDPNTIRSSTYGKIWSTVSVDEIAVQEDAASENAKGAAFRMDRYQNAGVGTIDRISMEERYARWRKERQLKEGEECLSADEDDDEEFTVPASHPTMLIKLEALSLYPEFSPNRPEPGTPRYQAKKDIVNPTKLKSIRNAPSDHETLRVRAFASSSASTNASTLGNEGARGSERKRPFISTGLDDLLGFGVTSEGSKKRPASHMGSEASGVTSTSVGLGSTGGSRIGGVLGLKSSGWGGSVKGRERSSFFKRRE